jgi:hypothetical protein
MRRTCTEIPNALKFQESGGQGWHSWIHIWLKPWNRPRFQGYDPRSLARHTPREYSASNMERDLEGLPSESMQTVWCWPPEKPTQDLVEFLKDVKFWGTKQDSVPGVPAIREGGVLNPLP